MLGGPSEGSYPNIPSIWRGAASNTSAPGPANVREPIRLLLVFSDKLPERISVTLSIAKLLVLL